MCHVCRFQRSCLCMYANCLFILRFVYVFILLYSSGMSRHISFLSPFYIVFQTHIHFFNVICHSARSTFHIHCTNNTHVFIHFYSPPPPGFWALCRTLGNFAQKCLQAKHPCFRVHPETRVWHSFLSDVRKSMITPRRAGRRLFSVFGIRDRESLGIWVDFEFACDFACSGCV